ncbi:Plasmid recombination enzyme [Andreprevotia lacus DSM 23236]|jgi:hypothetical protein|uniref:Plasmid recombination enzyme n=1 Tax=Andreprevotia lacus DSM 23236 TaxID=1121001 RepID=A0A1W1XUR9_9NEIS|nr:plasmid recombination protein [Andreprevotia lacus]SMC27646.1 Plasmid recombination enzyme [Andreprevotia lacus DSM 23236]
MPSQYLRFENFSRVCSQLKKNTAFSADGVLGEAMRTRRFSRHLENPHPPEVLLGSFEHAKQRVNTYPLNTKNSKGHALRKDANILLGIVFSIPRHWKNESENRFKEWRDNSLDFFKNLYGNRIVLAVQHNDESQPHIHIFVVPHDGEKYDTIRPDNFGCSANTKVISRSEKKGNVKSWQSHYYDHVSVKFALDRCAAIPGKHLRRHVYLDRYHQIIACRKRVLFFMQNISSLLHKDGSKIPRPYTSYLSNHMSIATNLCQIAILDKTGRHLDKLMMDIESIRENYSTSRREISSSAPKEKTIKQNETTNLEFDYLGTCISDLETGSIKL